MLIGTLLGDALGGPIEFASPDRLPADMPQVRRWADDEQLTKPSCRKLGTALKLRDYQVLRPQPAPFGPWRANAPAGTITDDSRHKIIFMRAIKRMVATSQDHAVSFDRPQLALEYLHPLRHAGEPESTTGSLDQEGFRPYRDAARWWVSDASLQQISQSNDPAFPPERLWAGVPNCSGQMALLPLASVFPGDPETAYRATYALDFLDSDHAIDFCAAINAGLANVIASKHDALTPQSRQELLLDTMRRTDPYRYADIPFTGRPFLDWLERGDHWASESKGVPKLLFNRLENEGKPHYWWDTHFTFLVPLTILQSCPDDPLAAMNLCLDFGHDTDSYAQLLGAWIGAIHGSAIFPESMVRQLNHRLLEDFGESIDDWCLTLMHACNRVRQQRIRIERGTHHGQG